MQKTENKTNNSVRSKLVAAIAMLLVATIMVVSSTYAWFTLSTKPEVSGISTAVGANGALEMLLLTNDEEYSGYFYNNHKDAEGVEGTVNRNRYWGNLVDLSDPSYGSQLITLYPSLLNAPGGVINKDAPVKFPTYGPDGRVNDVIPGGMFGIYNGDSFKKSEDYGFRGLGAASGLTERQIAFKSQLSEIFGNQSAAKSEAYNSLSQNGAVVANVAIKKVQGASECGKTEIDAVKSMVASLRTALAKVEDAYINALYAYAYSDNGVVADDVEAAALKGEITDIINGVDNPQLGDKVAAVLAKKVDIKEKLTGYATFTAAVTALGTAQAGLDAITGETCSVDQIVTALSPLVNIDKVKINGYTVEQAKDDKSALITEISKNGNNVVVDMTTGGGVYTDIADLCGEYSVEFKVDVAPIASLGEPFLVNAFMNANSTFNTPHFDVIRGALVRPESAGSDNPISEFYGYVIDLAFRTNAQNAKLLLQTEAADRIYNDNKEDAATYGKGSTMTFKTDDPNFSSQITSLMSHLRVVFYNTNDFTIYGEARLDTTNTTKDENGNVTAKLYMLEEDDTLDKDGDVEITALGTNQPKHVSVLVYLDGTTIENKDVAATALESMYGSLNLQFTTDAVLVPMDYADLHDAKPSTQG